MGLTNHFMNAHDHIMISETPTDGEFIASLRLLTKKWLNPLKQFLCIFASIDC